MTDSSTGGIIAPAGSPAPLEGDGLNSFLQPIIAGITGLPGNMVRPSFQAEPPDLPDAGQAWCAFRYRSRPSDTFPAIVHQSAGEGIDELQRYETIDILCSFYDLGTTGLADFYAAALRDGLAIPQNLESLNLNGMAMLAAGDLIAVPVLVKQRWMYRVDFSFQILRTVVRDYPVLNLLSAIGTIETGSLTETITVQ